jgi:hypothetical protein
MPLMENFHEPSAGDSDALEVVTHTARLKTGAKTLEQLTISSARRVPPPLRFGAALVYVLIHHKPGRDVGLAKVGSLPY